MANEHLDKARSGERKILVAASIGDTLVRALPLIQLTLAKRQDQIPPSEEEMAQFRRLHGAIDEYCREFPNPLFTGPVNRWPLEVQAEKLEYGLGNGWFERFNVYPFLNDIHSTLRSEFNLPKLDRYPDDIDQLKELVGVPKQYPGIRFMPGFRQLNWDTQGRDPHTAIVNPQRVEDRIKLRKPFGREFYLGSTHGLYGAENIFEFRQTRPEVSGIEFSEADNTQPPYILFDRDWTLTAPYIDRDKQPERYRAFVLQRDQLLLDLAQKAIPFGLWTRATPGDASSLVESVKKELGVMFSPAYDFGNWPGMVFYDPHLVPGYDPFSKQNRWRGVDVAFDPISADEMRTKVSALSPAVRKEVVRYAHSTFGTADINAVPNTIFDFLDHGIKYEEPKAPRFPENHNPLQEAVLQAKVPAFVSLLAPDLDDRTRIALLRGGVLIDDREASIVSAIKFGYNFIYVKNSEQLANIQQIL